MASSDGEEGPWSAEATEALQGRDHALVRQVRLRVVAGPDADKAFESSGDRTVIGTHPSTDFTLQDATMSRFHCEITLEKGKAIVRDLESRNGTIVDGVVVLGAELRDGATLALGRTKVRFELSDAAVRLPLSKSDRFGVMVGASRAMRAAFAILERAAASDVTVLLHGETGTGKDAAAESLHRESPRRDGPFVVVDCGAIPAGLLETELFGHERGAFTGADRERAGAFEAANKGTLFLDEIGELGLELQPKLLRVLEARSVQRVGGSKRLPVDVRVVAATNRNLHAEVNARRFRSDLFYRLAVLEVKLPPLRDRTEDLPALVTHLLDGMGAADSPGAEELRSATFATNLLRHPWPGNVRELRNYIERCVALRDLLPFVSEVADQGETLVDTRQPLRAARDRWVRFFEKKYLEELLRQHKNNVSAAARAAGVDRIHFHRLLARCGLR